MQKQIIETLKVKPTIDVIEEIKSRVTLLKQYLLTTGMRGYVLGISGGQDSTLAGKLAQIAINELNEEIVEAEPFLFITVRLPYGEQLDEQDAQDALEFINPSKRVTVNIKPSVDQSIQAFTDATGKQLSDFMKGNTKARERMKAQYDIGAYYNCLVIGTDHAAEAVTGFFTKHGDGACDILPLSGLNKRQGRQLLKYLGCPEHLFLKVPTADLEDDKPGLADEDALGFTYEDIDDYLEGKQVPPDIKMKIEKKYKMTEHKRHAAVTIYDDWWKYAIVMRGEVMANMSNADLHLHTTASDGGYSPKELVIKCKEVGLEYIAITDHDTVSGVKEAQREGAKNGITVIPGIEFSTKENGVSVHILGYGIDINDKALLKMLSEQQQLRKQRMKEMVQKFSKLNIKLEEEEIIKEADGGSIGRPHVAKVLVRMGVVKDVAEAFGLYLAEGKPCYVKKQREMTALEALKWIEATKGVAIIAHPVYYELDEKIDEWAKIGLLHGIEVYHRDHNEAVQIHYENLATLIENKYNITLLRTGGSDFHHEDYGRVQQPLGETRIPNQLALKLLDRINP